MSARLSVYVLHNSVPYTTSGIVDSRLPCLRCLSWGRLPGNNRALEFFGTVFESYANATDTLMGRLRSVLPEGSTKCRIRATARESRDPLGSGTLMDTMGEETVGMVMIDPSSWWLISHVS